MDYEPGTTQEVPLHDGSKILLKKLDENYDPTDRLQALRILHETARRDEFATGLLYVEPDKDDFIELLNLVDEPLASLTADRIRPPRKAFEEMMKNLR